MRLKGGDPFVFGRGGEEAAALARAGVPFEVVPGVTAALACAAQARIPLTLRGVSRSVTFVTGHTTDGVLDLDVAAVARSGGHARDLHGPRHAAEATRGIASPGVAPDTPAALIENGGTHRQRELHGTLDSVAATGRHWSTGGAGAAADWGGGLTCERLARLPRSPARRLSLMWSGSDGNRTRIASLEGWSSTIELHPRCPCFTAAAATGAIAARLTWIKSHRGSGR